MSESNEETLVQYRQMTLSNSADPAASPSDDPRRVILECMTFSPEDRDGFYFDLTGDLSAFKDNPIQVKEGSVYRIKLIFRVHHEMAVGLRYHHTVSRKGVTCDKQSYMVGTYGTSPEPHIYATPTDVAPKGMLARGLYEYYSKLVDDDSNVHLSWRWSIAVKSDWA